MDIINFVIIMVAVALVALGLALYIHNRKSNIRRDITDPKRDHVYRRYNRRKQVIKTENEEPFEF
ncbi:MAG: hypothetical protein E7137_00580 [Rikenellaceae bacterium]|nr:hypothetical protein [Rikenellaceae bacterium]